MRGDLGFHLHGFQDRQQVIDRYRLANFDDNLLDYTGNRAAAGFVVGKAVRSRTGGDRNSGNRSDRA